jgi:hypothetical protein
MISKRPKSGFYIFSIVLLSAAGILFILSANSSLLATSQFRQYKVTAPKGTLQEDGQDIILLQDYGSFGLYYITQDKWQQLPDHVRSKANLADDMDLILFDRNSFDTQQSARQPAEVNESDHVEALHLIQFVGPIKDEWLAAVQATGTELVHYVANNGYLVWTDASGRQKLNLLAESSDFLQYSAPYLPLFKLSPTLSAQQLAEDASDDLVKVTVQMYRHDGNDQSEEILRQLFVEIPSPWEYVLKYQNIVGTVHRQDISRISQLADVVWVGEQLPREQMDEVQVQIMANNLNSEQTAPSGPGYLAWLSALGFSTDPSDYPIVDITDDGIGNGQAALAAGDVTLRQMGDAAKPSRIFYIANCTSAPNGASTDGHGHINASIAGGYDDRPDFPFQDANGYQNSLGSNPFGRFAGTRVFGPDFDVTGCGGTDSSLIRETYNRGARIVSNSWGCSSCSGTYDIASQTYDAGVRDADSIIDGNQELFILFSAGNQGPDASTVGTPANGKNVLTVGASESVRPTWTDGCGIGTSGADNLQDIASFSSRGPAPGDRVKPELVAPGTHIMGTASPDPDYNGSGVCDQYYPEQQSALAAYSGKSHSTPAEAGLASLAYAYLQQQNGLEAPSPALLKGFLIAHTSYLTGVDALGNLPSHSQGFGLTDMTAAFDSTSRVIVDQSTERHFDQTGQTWKLDVTVADPAQPVRIVLAYTDQPGAIGTAPQVNNLDLSVLSGENTYLGNHMEGQWSTLGGSRDKFNNVEAVFLQSVTDPSLQIEVTAFNIAGDGVPGMGDDTDQDFAIVCSNCLEQEDFALSVQPKTGGLCRSGDIQYDITVNSIAGFADLVTLGVPNPPSGIASQLSKQTISPPGKSTLMLTATDTAAAVSHAITVTGQSETRQHSTYLNLDIFSDKPGTPILLQPSNQAIDQPLDVELSWTEISQVSSYDVQVATDINFDQIIDSASSLIDPTFKPAHLLPGQLYFWRVRAQNACGPGTYSTASSFFTKPLPGACPFGVNPVLIYGTDFDSESAQEGWTHNGLMDTWSLNDTNSHSKPFSYYAKDIESVGDQVLTSPAISLPSYPGEVTLQFWNEQTIESNKGSEEGSCYDGAMLAISTNLGKTWHQLANRPNDSSILLTDPYDGFVTKDYGNPLGGLPAWCGDPQAWLNSVIRLDDYKGRTVRFQFRLGTDETTSREGWYIDDVRVQACPTTQGFNYYLPFWPVQTET